MNTQVFCRGLFVFAMGLAVAGAGFAAQAPKPRKWKDASGQFEIEATFVSEANGVVTLKQTNGEEVEIELKQLSPADEAYVRTELASRNSPFKSKSSTPSPFQPKPAGQMPSAAGDAAASDSTAVNTEAPNPIVISWEQGSLLSPPAESNWKSISIQPRSAGKAKSAQLPANRDFFEKFTGMVACDGFAILGYMQPASPKRADSNTTRLLRVNIESGKVEGTIIVPGAYALLDASPSGQQILMRKEGDHGRAGSDLEIWKPAGKVVDRQRAFTPFAAEQHQKGVRAAYLGANNTIVVAGEANKAGIFSADTGDAIATTLQGYSICLSPDRRYAAVLTDSLLIVDLASGEAVASLPTDRKFGTVMAFSPDGKRLAAAFGNSITAWDMTTGEVYREEIMAGMAATSSLPFEWTSPTHLLVGMTLVDLENHLPLWTYTGANQVAAYGSTTLIAAQHVGQAGVLMATSLPHPAAQAALRQALASPNLFAVKPGTAVSVDVSGLPDAAEQQKARAGLEAQLAASGLKAAPGSPVVLKASLTSETKEESYRVFGAGFETRSVSVTRYTSKVELLVGGQVAWQSAAGGGPAFHVTAKANESLEDAVRNSSKPNYAFFSGVSIPQYVMQPGKATLGSSNVAG